ncbi:uncharacterized protein F5Z01DRAFT_269420 [Emericellopsis atlantica]|uniref:Uncharacterized protein n=1 Tax=Emericellopsis atlantica TaxID=2614577 RepID=A0A9P7ZH06_9HYPO|nr:uncharacterized protein F5Z01DRAFT_269420 [Emericellopsis atlantica]KAG9251556.1 hypothetical protein F5Z01DRAFT_269420 [Emericellopsis atlantica]
MPLADPKVQNNLGTSCSGNASFYVCDERDTKFLGCCSINPCKTDDGLCPDDDFESASYRDSSHALIMAQDCQSDAPEVQWWTCLANDPPFMGCCSLNPCAKGECPSKNLFPAKLSSEKENAKAFLPEDYYDEKGLSKGAIGGIAAGAVVGGLVVIGALIWFFLRRKKARKAATAAASSQSYEPYAKHGGSTMAGSEAAMSPHMQKHDPFPPYSPYQSTYTGTPNPQHQSMGSPPPQWHQQHGSPEMNNGAWGGVSTASPDPSQGQFRESMHSSYAGYGGQQQHQSFASELPATAEYTTTGHTHAAEMDGGSTVVPQKR